MMYTSAILALAASASAHMLLEYPTPFPTTGNGPVEEDGSNFPCRPSGGYASTPATPVKAGAKLTVKFKGSAVHSGGSCQISLSTDKAPSKSSQWKVIHSVMGGCLTDKAGNLDPNPNGSGAKPITVTIPGNLPDGQYTLSWSWLNKSGNREFYHNCAPIAVSGGSGKDVKAALGSLPDMFVTNLPPTKCKMPEGNDFAFPNPGKSVEKGGSGPSSSALVGSDADCKAMQKMGAGNGQLGSPSGGGGNTEKPKTETPKTETPKTETPKTETPAPAGGSGSSCSKDGAIICIGSSQFGICANGNAIPQALAAGTKCSNGAITRRSVRRAPRGQYAATQ